MNIKKLTLAAATTAIILSAAVLNVSAAPSDSDVIVFDNNYAWTDSTMIDLFERNELNNQLVYPGVTGYYCFTVRNSSEMQKECEVIIEDENKFAVPLDVRIKKDGLYILGSENEWVTSAAFDSDVYLIEPKTDNVYELEFKWDYYNNESDDRRDTALGVNAHYENEPYNITINVLAENEPESSTPDSSQPSESSTTDNSQQSAPQDTPTTGDNQNLSFVLSMGILSLSIIAAYISVSKKRNVK